MNRQSGECWGEVSSSRSRCSLNHVQPKSEPRARQTRTFIESRHAHAWHGNRNTGTSPLVLRLMQMATVGAAICISKGMDCNWTKVIYATTIATA